MQDSARRSRSPVISQLSPKQCLKPRKVDRRAGEIDLSDQGDSGSRKCGLSPRSPRKGERNPHSARNGDLSPRSPRNGDLSPRSPRNGDLSPRSPQKGARSPQRTPRNDDHSPRAPRKSDLSPRTPRKGERSPQRTPRAGDSFQQKCDTPQFHLAGARRVPSISGRRSTTGGKRRALLIGINYLGQTVGVEAGGAVSIELDGCQSDTGRLEKLLLASGYKQQDIRIMTEASVDTSVKLKPLRKNILTNLHWLVSGAVPGDSLFFGFSGHGMQEEDPHGYEEDGMNETILPVDWQSEGCILDDQLNEILVSTLPEGCKLTCFIDACHSGTAMDLPFRWRGNNWRLDTNPLYARGDVVLFSGCKDKEVSLEGRKGGAMTEALVVALKHTTTNLTYVDLFDLLNKELRRGGFTQRPVMTSSQSFSKDRVFSLLSDRFPNKNKRIGRVIKKRFEPREEKTGLCCGLTNSRCLMYTFALVFGLVLGAAVGAGVFFGTEDVTSAVIAGVSMAVFAMIGLILLLGNVGLKALLRVKLLRVRDKLGDLRGERAGNRGACQASHLPAHNVE